MSDRNRTIARGFFEHLYAGRFADALALAAPDFEYQVLGVPEDFPLAGRYSRDRLSDLMAIIGPTVPQGAHPTITSVLADGDAVAVIGHVEAVAASGRDYANNFVFIVTLRGDLITKVDEYIDTQHASDVLFGNPPMKKGTTMTGTTHQLDEHDEAAIRSVIERYSETLDRRDFARLADSYTENATLENTFESYIPFGSAFTGVLAKGAPEIAAAVGNLMGPLDATQHFLGSILFDVTDEGVRTQTQVIAHHHRGQGFFHTGGTYIDDFVKTDAGWRTSRRVLHTSWTTGDPKVVTGD